MLPNRQIPTCRPSLKKLAEDVGIFRPSLSAFARASNAIGDVLDAICGIALGPPLFFGSTATNVPLGLRNGIG